VKACRLSGLCVLLLVAGCGGGSSPGSATAQARVASVERAVDATATAANITAIPAGGEAPHVAINPSPAVTPRGKLLVFIPGTQGRPSQYTYILRAGAARGFHAVGINYLNQTAMGSLCQFSTNPDCYWTARTEVVFGNGTPVSGQGAVSRADSIVNRLNQLLAWSSTNQPAEGWSSSCAPTGQWTGAGSSWPALARGRPRGCAGQDGGAGPCRLLLRPEDWNELTNRPAGWTATRANVTPASLQYAFGSDLDTLVPNAHAFAHWDALGLARPAAGAVLVDDTPAPFLNSHQLRTSLGFNPASTALTLALRHHGVTVVDASTPIDGAGKPLFDSNGVWESLCFQ
jgi:hypothetical protein